MEASPDASRVEAHVEFTQTDVLHGLQSMPERRFGAVAGYLLAALMLGWIGLTRGFEPTTLWAIVIGSVFLVGLNRFSTRRVARQFFEDMTTREINYVFTPLAVEITTKHASSRHDYEAIRRFVITGHTLLLYVSGNVAQMVPLRVFDAPDKKRVLGWLKAQVKPAPRVPVSVVRTLRLWGILVVAFLVIWWLLDP